MKLNMSESLREGVARNFTKEKRENAPDYIRRLLDVEGVQGVFQVNNFIALERHPKADWKSILSHVGTIFGDESSVVQLSTDSPSSAFGEVQVLIQMFKDIPLQVKLLAGAEEMRFGLPESFSQAVMKLQQTAANNYLLERKWVDQGVRYGTFQEVGEEVAAELTAAYDEQRWQP